jgi:hypothetical protein
VHAYMRKRRKTEAKEKAEELESTRLRVATDNLAVLAQARSASLKGLRWTTSVGAADAISSHRHSLQMLLSVSVGRLTHV